MSALSTDQDSFGLINTNIEKKANNTLSILFYTLKDILFWWYIQMPYWHLKRLKHMLMVLDDKLSITLLIKTFFVPWHRDDKGIGPIMGVLIRLLYLPFAFLIWLLSMIIYLLIIGLWLVTPILAVIFMIITPFLKNS